VTIYDPTVEYVLLAKAGMTFPQILASLTTAPAERFGDAAKLGRIAPGLTADLTVIRTDPTKDIRALSVIDYTIRDGKVIYRAPRSRERHHLHDGVQQPRRARRALRLYRRDAARLQRARLVRRSWSGERLQSPLGRSWSRESWRAQRAGCLECAERRPRALQR